MLKKMYAVVLTIFLSGILIFSSMVVAADSEKVRIRVFTPLEDDLAGVNSRGFVVDLRFKFTGDLESTGVTVTEPEEETEEDEEDEEEGSIIGVDCAAKDSEFGANPNFPGLVVLLSSSKVGAGAGQNLANLFDFIGVSHRNQEDESGTENDARGTTSTHIWTTWYVITEDEFGTVGEIEPSTLFVAVVDGTAFDLETPDIVEDMNDDGKLTRKDLKRMGYRVISEVQLVKFDVNGL